VEVEQQRQTFALRVAHTHLRCLVQQLERVGWEEGEAARQQGSERHKLRDAEPPERPAYFAAEGRIVWELGCRGGEGQ